MFKYQPNKDAHDVFKITMIINNTIDKCFIDKIIDLLIYIISILKLKYNPHVNIVTVYPKIYTRSIIIDDILQFYNVINKIVRNKKQCAKMTSIDEISNENLDLIEKNILQQDDIHILLFADTDGLFLRESLDKFKGSWKFYCHQSNQLIDKMNINNIIIGSSAFDDDQSMNILNKILFEIIRDIDTNNVLTNITYFKNEIQKCTHSDISKEINIQTNKNIYDVILVLISGARCILMLEKNSLEKYHIHTFKNISNEILKLHKINIQNTTYFMLINSLYRIMHNITIKHCDKIYKSFENDNNKSNEDDLMNSLQILSNKSAHVYKHKQYLRKKVDMNITNDIHNNVKKIFNEIIDDIDEIEDKFQNCMQQEDIDIYKTILTMSDWTDELRSGTCIGIILDLKRLPYKKGRYDIILNPNPIYIGSINEMLCMLQINSMNTDGVINIQNNIIMNNVNDETNTSKFNCMIPLYIDDIHWKLAKHYLNLLCNIIMYDSLNVNDKSAWKIIYIVLIQIGSNLINIFDVNRTIKYMFSLWLTACVLSKEHRYVSGLNGFLKKIYNNKNFRNNIDPIMIAGQIISIGMKVNKKYITFIKKEIFKTCYIGVINDIVDSDIYNDCTNIENIKDENIINKVIDPERFIEKLKSYDVIYKAFDMIRFISAFEILLNDNGYEKLFVSLKNNFGIPSNKIITDFKDSINNAKCEDILLNIICETDYGFDNINCAMKSYKENIHHNIRCAMDLTKEQNKLCEINDNVEEELFNDIVEHGPNGW